MLLSIIVSVYNLEKFVADCLESLAKVRLSSGAYEILVIDDGSTDESSSIIKKYANENSQIRCFFQENQGVGSARNLGVKYAKGEYLWFVDGDDYIQSDKVNRCVEEAIAYDVDVLAFDYFPVNELGLKEDWISFKLNFPNSETVDGSKFYYDNFAKSYIWLYFFRREIFIKYNLRFEDSIRMQDGEIMPRIFMHSSKVKFRNEKLIYYRFRANSAVNDKNEDVRSHFYYSMVIVADRLRTLQQSFSIHDLMYRGLALKRSQLNQMLFTNLVFNKYSKESNAYFIKLLRDHRLIPFKKITGFTSNMNLVYNFLRKIVNISPMSGRLVYHKVFAKKWF